MTSSNEQRLAAALKEVAGKTDDGFKQQGRLNLILLELLVEEFPQLLPRLERKFQAMKLLDGLDSLEKNEVTGEERLREKAVELFKKATYTGSTSGSSSSSSPSLSHPSGGLNNGGH